MGGVIAWVAWLGWVVCFRGWRGWHAGMDKLGGVLASVTH